MLHIVLFEPEIPPNTGNVIRLCANTGAMLHLIKPMAFELDDKKLKRAGLDYHEYADIQIHENFNEMLEKKLFKRIVACETVGTTTYSDFLFQADDAILFGPETRGLPPTILNQFEPKQMIRIPMLPHNRSLNLSNSVAIVLYEAWRQFQFNGCT